mgnify:FL=1
MPLFKLLIAIGISVLSTQALAEACPASNTLASINNPCTVTGTHSSFKLNFNSGFADTSRLSPIDGNPGNTVGSQRQYSFIKAAELLANKIASDVVIEVDAYFNALTCNDTTAILGSAGATNNFSHPFPPNGIQANTFYPVSLYSAISGIDEDFRDSDITAEFNKNIGNSGCLEGSSGWYYGFASPSNNRFGFTTVLLHELTHGLGFASLINPETGKKPNRLNDIFSSFLFDKDRGSWPNLSDSQRLTSAKNSGGLLWDGEHVNEQAIELVNDGFEDNDLSNTFTSGDRVEMYAPDPVESGSSISHFSTLLSPNELMEPEYTEGQYELGLGLYLLQDLGWLIRLINEDQQQISIDGITLDDGDSITLDLNNKQLDVTGGSDEFSFNLLYQGNNVDELLSENESGLSISLPSSGAFAGTYTLTITDAQSNQETTISIIRPLRLNWSTTSLLNGDLTQTLKIEGAAAGSQFSISQSADSLLTFNDTLIASNNAQNFNVAISQVLTETVLDITELMVTVSAVNANYEDASSTIEIHPSQSHYFSVVDEDNQPITNAVATLNENSTLNSFNLSYEYVADNNGQFYLVLPIDEQAYELTIAASHFSPVTLSIFSDTSEHIVMLEAMEDPIILSGIISVNSDQDFTINHPTALLRFLNTDPVNINITVMNAQQASFSHEVDLGQFTLLSMDFQQINSQSSSLDVSDTHESQHFEVLLQANGVSVDVNSNNDSNTENDESSQTSSSGGGTINFYLLLGLLIFITLRRRVGQG